MAKSAQRQFLVSVSGIPGYFMTKGGGNITSDTNKVYDGGSTVPDVLAGPAEADNITVSRGYDPTRDAALLTRLRQRVGRFEATISVTPTNRDMVAISKPTVYPKALLVGLTEPESDASSGEAATYELEFAIGQFK